MDQFWMIMNVFITYVIDSGSGEHYLMLRSLWWHYLGIMLFIFMTSFLDVFLLSDIAIAVYCLHLYWCPKIAGFLLTVKRLLRCRLVTETSKYSRLDLKLLFKNPLVERLFSIFHRCCLHGYLRVIARVSNTSTIICSELLAETVLKYFKYSFAATFFRFRLRIYFVFLTRPRPLTAAFCAYTSGLTDKTLTSTRDWIHLGSNPRGEENKQWLSLT